MMEIALPGSCAGSVSMYSSVLMGKVYIYSIHYSVFVDFIGILPRCQIVACC